MGFSHLPLEVGPDQITTLNEEEFIAALGGLDEYFEKNPHLVVGPPIVGEVPLILGTSMDMHQQNGGLDAIRGHSQYTHTIPSSSPLSPSSPSLADDTWPPLCEPTADTYAGHSLAPSSNGMSPSSSAPTWNHPGPSSTTSLSSSSSPHPVHPVAARVETLQEAIVLWLVNNGPPAYVSTLIHRSLSLKDPESEFSVMVLRAIFGDDPVTPKHVYDFEKMVYDEARRCRFQRRTS